MIALEIMSKEPIVVRVTDSIRRAISATKEGDVRHLPVLEEGRLVGIVSDRDLRDAYRSVVHSAGVDDSPLDESISRIMNSDVISVDAETDLGDVIDLMIEHKVGALPVVEADSMSLLGIVSYVDVLRAAREALA